MTAEAPRHTNRLAGETSPYLLQHAHNPVDWYPWGPEALERAWREDKPILLSIGYAACHWCHVMERESFENEAIAKLMNEHFVCIKVDREERPDLDDVYMAATVAMSGGGGWPMTVFLTPDQRPFFAGTYFPPADRYGRPGFPSLLERISDLWRADRQALTAQAAELTAHVRAQGERSLPLAVGERALRAAVQELRTTFDARWGGFGAAPKFPPPGALSLLLRWYRRTTDERALTMVKTTLDGMRRGGMYDHVGGGFARYSTDERWLVPHFEKMLYDNAQLARVYLEAYQVTSHDDYRRVAVEVLDYILREMQGPEGGYYSATDADSEGEEGKFFVWRPDEIRELLERDAAERFCLYYDITEQGNWEGTNIPNTPRSLDEVAREAGMAPGALAAELEQSRQRVYEARRLRVPPLCDDKVLVSWNALMIGAMAEGFRVLGDRRYLDSAERAASFLLRALRRPDGGLFRTARAGKAHLDAYLEDYAYLSDALVGLYEAGAHRNWLDEAVKLAERMITDFSDRDGGPLYHTAHSHEALIVRPREGHDGAVPNPNSVAASALARLSHHFAREDFRALAENAVFAYGRQIERSPRAFATALAVVDFLLEGPVELAFVGTPGEPGYEALLREVRKRYLPNRIVGHLAPAQADAPETAPLPLVAGKRPISGRAALYVCRNFTCRAPVTEPLEVGGALDEAERSAIETRRSEVGAQKLAGSATAQGTANYADCFRGRGADEAGALGEHAYSPLGQSGLTVSRVGFGGYRIDEDENAHRASLCRALENGVNLIDTSTNYGNGGSERLIGSVLRDLVGERKLAREQVVVVSKIGYVQAENMELVVEREAQGKPFAEVVKYAEGVWHCMHPDWLEDQLDRSLGRLGLETLDVCLVHNPEYYLSDAVKRGEGPLDSLREEFYRRLQAAFGHFEKEVARGRLRAYGVSSNTSVAPADHREATQLSRMLEAARAAGGTPHHFRVLELPMNLLEAGALLEENDAGKTVLEVARENRVAVLVNRPLNAILGEGLLRLADPPELGEAPPFEASLAAVARLEDEFRRTLAPQLRAAPGSARPDTFFNWAEQLGQLPARLESFEQWQEIEGVVIAPRIGHLFRALDQAFTGEGKAVWREWRERYLPELEKLLAALRSRAAERSGERTAQLRASIEPLLPGNRQAMPFSQVALWALTSVPEVTCVLLGMRQPRYVNDALGMLAWEPLAAPERLFRAVQQT
jgi:hypothetical protein